MHRGLAYVVARLLRQAGAAKTDIVFEVSNLRAGDKTRPGDVVWLHFLGPGQHLLIDVSITGVYRDAVLDDVSRIPGFAAKAREDAKLDEDFRSASPVSQCHGGRHRLVPFVLEEGGRFGDHALAYSCRRLLSLGLRQASSRRQNPGPPRAQMLPLRTGCASGSRRSLDGSRSPCLTLFFARHLVPPCMGPKLRTLGL